MCLLSCIHLQAHPKHVETVTMKHNMSVELQLS